MNLKLSIKWIGFFLSVLFIAKDACLSGMSKEIELKSRLTKEHNVFVVKIIGSSSVKIKEIGEVSKDTAVANQHYYSAKIVEIINKCISGQNDEESWTMLFSPDENPMLKKIEVKGTSNVELKDTIIIMDHEDLLYTYMYEVEEKHKIFYYYYCADAATDIKVGNTYLFIGGRSVSKKNGVFYGNVDYGLYPNTKSMRKKIEDILQATEY